ncbi:hypothetical protein GGR51DRAFT_119155 [Nemania sp. FL0031]|nr:hypothetical protein GGR51DRAFT_119155 [Nemania sp. FL0031]
MRQSRWADATKIVAMDPRSAMTSCGTTRSTSIAASTCGQPPLRRALTCASPRSSSRSSSPCASTISATAATSSNPTSVSAGPTIREAIREAQNGGSGVVVYFHKEGRALGEVVKYLVYNARKRGGDTPDKYFQRTESVASVRDMRFQASMPDILHWLGITKIDTMLSMSNMKHDAIVGSSIPILERIPIPDELIPADSGVEIDAKVNAGYFTTGKVCTGN